MATPDRSFSRVRFGDFELNPRTGELIRNGDRLQLHEGPLQVLLALLERPGDLVTREELTSRLWPAGTFVDFERGLNKAVNKLREALRDSADHPRIIETVPRKGYRFIGDLKQESQPAQPPDNIVPIPTRPAQRSRRKWQYLALAGAAALALLIVWKLRSGPPPLSKLKPATVQIDSVAVLPLENLSRDPEQAYFTDGMTDALITEVAQAGTLRVISRTTMLHYRGTQLTAQQIGRELGVDALVEGTVLRSGDKLRITAQLIHVPTDNHLWAQSYEGGVSEILRLQQEVATDIARHVGRVVKPVEPLGTVNPEAYGEYLKGHFYFFQYTSEGWQKAIEHFSRAVQIDPSFAPAYAGLAQSYVVSWAWSAPPSNEDLRKGKDAAQKALGLEPALASAHLAMGEYYVQEWDSVNAEKELALALNSNPNDPLAWQLHGVHLLLRGRFEDGIAEQQQARKLDPFSPIVNANLVRAFYFSRQYDKAIEQAQETLKLAPGYSVALHWQERAYRHKGMLKEAYAAHVAAAKPEEVRSIEQAYRAAGYRGVLLLQAEADVRSGDSARAALSFAQAGEEKQALTLLEACYRRHCPGLLRLQVEPDFDPIRSDPRYQKILRRVGYWE
jgi:TolB-like protein/DNA-binding winged helix-turn-helix (wHTH) protein/Tfp pilus assembly protein PilF